jgi:hypothetical protein
MHYLLTSLAAAFFITGGGSTHAADNVYVLLASKHVGAIYAFNEVNPGIFLEWDGTHINKAVGVYKNSFGDVSTAAIVSVPVLHGNNWSIELFGGVAHYPGTGDTFAYHFGDVVPIGGLQASVGYIIIQAMPGGSDMDAVISVALRIPLTN